jgi:hypothetical protein
VDRKEFLQKMCFASGCLLLFPGTTLGVAKQQNTDARKKFFEEWIISWLENLIELFGEEGSIRFMEACGRDCAVRNGGVAIAEKCRGNVEELLAIIAEYAGKDNCYLKDDKVFIKLTSCSCPIVSKGPERLHRIYCHCSRSNVETIFTTAASKNVRVELLQSLKCGDPCCEFLVHL